ncbi:hypothetical protein Tco_0566587 [Tanacetum coccineum]
METSKAPETRGGEGNGKSVAGKETRVVEQWWRSSKEVVEWSSIAGGAPEQWLWVIVCVDVGIDLGSEEKEEQEGDETNGI